MLGYLARESGCANEFNMVSGLVGTAVSLTVLGAVGLGGLFGAHKLGLF